MSLSLFNNGVCHGTFLYDPVCPGSNGACNDFEVLKWVIVYDLKKCSFPFLGIVSASWIVPLLLGIDRNSFGVTYILGLPCA